MVNLDIQNGVVQYTPPALAAGEVTTRLLGITINEWFYIVAILSMLISTATTTYVAVRKARKENT